MKEPPSDRSVAPPVPRLRVFSPPVTSRSLRRALALVLGLVLVAPMLIAGSFAVSPPTITLRIDAGRLHAGARTGFFLTDRDVALASISDARRVHLQKGSRVMGTGMPGLCSGRWRYADLGDVWQAADCGSGAVVIDTGAAARLVVAPEDPAAFLRALEGGAAFESTQVSAATSGLRALFALLALALVAVVAWFVALCGWGAERMRYVVGPGWVEVRTILGTHRQVTSGLVARRRTGRIGWRVAGTAMPGLYTGWYRVDGRSARIWTTRPSDGVLLEGNKRWVVSPEHEAAFVAALREAGAQVHP